MIVSTRFQALLASLEPVEDLHEFKRLAEVVDTHGVEFIHIMQCQDTAHYSHVAKLERPASFLPQILDKFYPFNFRHDDISDKYVSTEIFRIARAFLVFKQRKFCRVGEGCDLVPLAGESRLEKSANVRVVIKNKDAYVILPPFPSMKLLSL